MNRADFEADLAAFADDEEETIVDPSGSAMLTRGGQTLEFRIVSRPDGADTVVFQDREMPYREFLGRHLANLDILAERILHRQSPIPGFVEGPASLQRVEAGDSTGSSLALLEQACNTPPTFASRVLFLTAEAGQGKTALLKQFQVTQAARFRRAQTPSLFWHVDLQGRQLLRLSEALLGDLGDMRISGLWMPGIIRLLQHRLLILAIDGFDELAAEQGSTDALGALALLVRDLGESGTIVAASRRTFFNTDDYLRRAQYFAQATGGSCEFDQLSLLPWGESEAKLFLSSVDFDGKTLEGRPNAYQELVEVLGAATHPMLTRPFLLSQIARALVLYDLAPREFVRGLSDPLQGVGDLIRRFVRREVTEKWKQKDTGEAFLTEEQHFELLASIAEEMFSSQRILLPLEIIDALTAALLDTWTIEASRRPQIFAMVHMHALLVPLNERMDLRGFEHEEFRDWFTAYALRRDVERLATTDVGAIVRMLSQSPLTDATARYVCALMDRQATTRIQIAHRLCALVTDQWRSTYLQQNVGTLLPFLLDGVEPDSRISLDAKIVFGSLVFEGTRLTDVAFEHATLVRASLSRCTWKRVTFVDCNLGELTISRSSNFAECEFVDCRIDGIVLLSQTGEEDAREYAPDRVARTLETLGIALGSAQPRLTPDAPLPAGDLRRLTSRLLRLYRRTTTVHDTILRSRFPNDFRQVIEEVIPILERWRVVEEVHWRGSGQQHAWALRRSVDDILKADGHPEADLNGLWREIDASSRS
jgi:hypothetical protein